MFLEGMSGLSETAEPHMRPPTTRPLPIRPCMMNPGGVTDPIPDIEGSKSDLQGALAAVIGRYSYYNSSFNFGSDGSLLPAGAGVMRDWADEEYEMYAQDTWRLRPNLTLTLGLHYSLDRPIYESNGMEVKPTTGLAQLFDQRVAAAAKGIVDDTLVSLDKSGPVNGKSGMYPWDKNNFAPLAAIGGFHLMRASDETPDWTAQKLREFGLANFIGAHCTGIEPVYRIREKSGLKRQTCIVGGVGDKFSLERGIIAGLLTH